MQFLKSFKLSTQDKKLISSRVLRLLPQVLSVLLLSGCLSSSGLLSDEPQALRETPQGNGPKVIYDFLAKPLPEIPLPNDSAMRYDHNSATQARVNVSYFASTDVERRAREAFNQLDGFGTYAPITVSFDQPLDVIDLYKRHNEHDPTQGLYRDDFRNDAVYLLNVDPQCERFSEEIALDIGRGRFPVTLFKHLEGESKEGAPRGVKMNYQDLFYFSYFDPHATSNNLLFEEWNEDLNQNGILDEGEDRDGDGILDVANLLHPNACDSIQEGTLERHQCIADELMSFYERESNTLILRPVWPLEQGCRHAVVLSNRLIGENGEAIQSPFEGVNPSSQTQALKAIEPWLGRYDLNLDDVAFAWTFTTGSMTKDLEALRAGLYGSGPFSQLKEQFSVKDLHLWTRAELDKNDEVDESLKENRFLPGDCSGIGLSKFWQVRGEWEANLCALEADFSGMSMIFGGTFTAPDLLYNRDENIVATKAYPQTADERWEVDAHQALLKHDETEVTFWCGLPQELDQSCSEGNPEGKPFCKPFPTILYAHGYGGSRAEITVGHIGRTTSMGYAMCALDAYGHGLNALLSDHPDVLTSQLSFRLLAQYGLPDFQELLLRGRDRDLNNDGLQDSGADMWTSDIFHTRDMVRQTSLEYMQFVRILRNADGTTVDRQGYKLGDVDGDGTIDFGGPNNTIGMWGISLGGIIAGVLAGAEPGLDTVSPNAGGAGLVDIGVRSSQAGVPEAVMLPVLGPFIVGCTAMNDLQRPITDGEGKSCFKSQGFTPNPHAENDEEPIVPNDEKGILKVGELELAYLLNNNARQQLVPFAKLQNVEPGDWIEIENLNNGEIKRRPIDEKGRLMLSIPADALTASEKRPILGLNDQDREPVSVVDSTALGDKLIIRHFKKEVAKAATEYDERGEYDVHQKLDAVAENIIDQFMWPIVFQGAKYAAGQTLVALQEGLGLDRNGQSYRRFMGLAQQAICPGDPAVWSEKISHAPLKIDYDRFQGGHTHVLQMPTIGDTQVPTNTGIAAARIHGVLGSWTRDESKYSDPHYGWRELFQPLSAEYELSDPTMSADQLLIETYVIEGDSKLQRWSQSQVNSDVYFQSSDDEMIHPYVLYDVENISDGEARFSCDIGDWSARNGEYRCPDDWKDRGQTFPIPYFPKGLRLTWEREDGRFDALRVPLIRPSGQHGIYNAQPFRIFDHDAFMVNYTTRFLGTGGRQVDHPAGCDCSSSVIPKYTLNGRTVNPTLTTRACEEQDLNLCDASCSEAWGLRQRESVVCDTP